MFKLAPTLKISVFEILIYSQERVPLMMMTLTSICLLRCSELAVVYHKTSVVKKQVADKIREMKKLLNQSQT